MKNYTASEVKALQTKVFGCNGTQVTAYLKENAAKRLGVGTEDVQLLTHRFNSHQSPVEEIVEKFDGYDENGMPCFSYSIEMKNEF